MFIKYLPKDWENPDWSRRENYAHDWHRYVPEDLRNIWLGFTAEQKMILAGAFEEIASKEEWD